MTSNVQRNVGRTKKKLKTKIIITDVFSVQVYKYDGDNHSSLVSTSKYDVTK